MFADYQQRILRELEKRKAGKTLSLLLLHPTPAKLKQASLLVCKTRYSRKDEQVLSSFFEPQADGAAYVKAINKCGIDKFRPLIKFINRETKNPDEKVVELLAWLIEFTERPYDDRVNYNSDISGEALVVAADPVISEPVEEEITELGTPGAGEERTNRNEKLERGTAAPGKKIGLGQKRKILAAIISIAVIGCVFFLWKMQYNGSPLNGRESCMYWKADHYEPVSCNKKMGDTLVIALDSTRMLHFQRIMNPDTITYKEIGKVWYIKKDGKLEYYTGGGRHPVYSNSTLRPIADHIIRTYIFPDTLK